MVCSFALRLLVSCSAVSPKVLHLILRSTPASKQYLLDLVDLGELFPTLIMYIFFYAPMKTFSFTPVTSVENDGSQGDCYKERGYLK